MPEWSRFLRRRLADLRLRPEREAEIVEELSQHAEDRYEDLLRQGAAEPEAVRGALGELRGVGKTMGAGAVRAGLAQDIRYGLRTLGKSPGFTLVAALTLALGIGANTAIFSVVNGVLLQPLAYPEPDRLTYIYESSPDFSLNSVAYPNYLDWRREAASFSGMGAMRTGDFNLTGEGEPEQVDGAYVTPSLMQTLGVSPLLGRLFSEEEGRQGAGCTVLLAHRFWQRRFGASTGLVGRTLTLNASRCTVIGVMPASFRLSEEADLFMPLEQWNSASLRLREAHPGLRVIARLKPGVTPAAAEAEVKTICARLAREYPKSNARYSARLKPMKDDLVGQVRPTLLLIMGAVGFVLVIACANVANLMLARSAARRREFAIRMALGAGRGRLVRQLLTESVLLSLGAAVAGLALARWGAQLLLAASPIELPRADQVSIDPAVLAFTLGVSVLTGVLFGLAPAWHSAKEDPQDALKEGARGAGGGRHRTESVFVAVEIALAVVLLAGAGLMMQTMWRLWSVEPGLNPRNVLTTRLALSPGVMKSAPAIRLAFDAMLRRVRTVPGVEAAAVTSVVPLSEDDSEITYWAGSGPQPAADQTSMAMFYIATPGYLEAMGVPLRRGRFFSERDNQSAPPVVVIDDVMAQRLFPGQDPVGRVVSLMVVGPVQIVGVVGHVKHWGLDADDTARVRDQMYFPMAQVPDMFMTEAVAGMTLVARTAAEPLSLSGAVRREVAGPTLDQPIYQVRTMEQILQRSLAARRFTTLVLGVFACVALLLAATGIYGVMSYAVNLRTHEFGIRATLGASRSEVLWLVLRRGLHLAGTGLVLGLAAAFAATRLLTGVLYGVQPMDPATLAGVAALLLAVALLACFVPARRATAVDPVTALRCE